MDQEFYNSTDNFFFSMKTFIQTLLYIIIFELLTTTTKTKQNKTKNQTNKQTKKRKKKTKLSYHKIPVTQYPHEPQTALI